MPKNATMTVRLSSELDEKLAALARDRKRSKSDLASEAIAAYRASLAIDERLATADRSNVGAESGQSASYVKVADTLQGQMPQIRAFSLSR